MGAAELMLTACYHYDDYPYHHSPAYSGHGQYYDHGYYNHDDNDGYYSARGHNVDEYH